MNPTTKYTSLDAINGSNENPIIKVKIILLWRSYYNSNLSSLDMILMDDQGHRITASVTKTLIERYENLLEEGGIRIISNFNVIANKTKVRPVAHKLKISFNHKTSIKLADDFNSEHDVFNFITFQDVFDEKVNSEIAFDVIGRVISGGEMTIQKLENRERRVLNFQLQDEKNKVISCALWDTHAIKLHKYIEANKNSKSPIVIIIQLAKLGMYKKNPQISNCYSGAKLYINEDIPAITAFIQRAASSTTNVDLSTNTVFTSYEENFTTKEFKTIEELLQINTTMACVVVGRVLKIEHEMGWYYLACRKCNLKVELKDDAKNIQSQSSSHDSDECAPDKASQFASNQITQESTKSLDDLYKCRQCPNVLDVYPRMMVYMKVEDPTGSATFTIFEKEIVKHISKSGEFLLTKSKNEEDSSQYPNDLNYFLNKEYAFVVKIADFNLKKGYFNLTINTLTDDANIIKKCLPQSAPSQEIISKNKTSQLALGETPADCDGKDVISVTEDDDDTTDDITQASTPATKRPAKDLHNDLLLQSSSSKITVSGQKLKKPKIEKN